MKFGAGYTRGRVMGGGWRSYQEQLGYADEQITRRQVLSQHEMQQLRWKREAESTHAKRVALIVALVVGMCAASGLLGYFIGAGS
jgi:hypothetical protein